MAAAEVWYTRLRPKSHTFARKLASSSTLRDLRSLCKILREWRYAIPRAVSRAIMIRCLMSSLPCFLRKLVTEPFTRKSDTRIIGSEVLAPSSRMTFGCRSILIMHSSFSKLEMVSLDVSALTSCLHATSVPCQYAFHTFPKAPWPTTFSSSSSLNRISGKGLKSWPVYWEKVFMILVMPRLSISDMSRSPSALVRAIDSVEAECSFGVCVFPFGAGEGTRGGGASAA
mmetsp:Transcript_9408/g.16200  ORF Transcript_9408/g.16200 Transcript_9408/m.16200 type:complete len:228 (-) Transcript_9408:457-1140(-)